jgi:hypothetical protein
MTDSELDQIRKINFLLERAALSRANAFIDEVPRDVRRRWLEDAEQMTDYACRLIEQVNAARLLRRAPAWELSA